MFKWFWTIFSVGPPRRYVKVVVRTALLKQQDLDTAVIIKVSALSSTLGNSGLIADSFKPRGKNLGTWNILVNVRTGLLLYSLRHLCLLKFNPKDKCDVMLIYFILLGEEVGGTKGCLTNVKCRIEYRAKKSTTHKLWQIIKFLSRCDDNSWHDEDKNHSNEYKN